MKKNTKKITTVLLCGVMASATLAGCVGPSDYPVEEGATVLKLWAHSFEDWADNLLTEQVKEFNSILDDGIQIDLKFYGDDNAYDTAIAAGFENDSVADIFMAQYDRIYTYLKAGYIAPVGDYLTEEEQNDFFDTAREEVTYIDPDDGQEKLYACPWYLEPAMMFFYRKDIFEQAGVDKVPTSWEELYAACDKVAGYMDSSRNQFAISIPTNAVELTWTTYGMIQDTTGGLAVDESWLNSRVDTNEEGFKHCAEFWYTMSNRTYAPIASLTPEGYTDSVDALCEGKVGMCLSGSWSIGRIYNYYPDAVDKIGVAKMPTMSGDQSGVTSCNGGWTYVMSAKMNESKRELAAQFLRWYFFNPENASRYFDAAYYCKAPTTKSVKDYIEAKDKSINPEWVACVNEVAESSVMAPSCAWAVSNQIGQLFEYMLNHGKEGRTFAALFSEKIAEVKAAIDTTISQPGYEGNPKYKAS